MQSLHAPFIRKKWPRDCRLAAKAAAGKPWARLPNTQCSSCCQETTPGVWTCCRKRCTGPSQGRTHGNPSPATQICSFLNCNCLATYWFGLVLPFLLFEQGVHKPGQRLLNETSEKILVLFSSQWHAPASASACCPFAKASALARCTSLYNTVCHTKGIIFTRLLHMASRAHPLIAADSLREALPDIHLLCFMVTAWVYWQRFFANRLSQGTSNPGACSLWNAVDTSSLSRFVALTCFFWQTGPVRPRCCGVGITGRLSWSGGRCLSLQARNCAQFPHVPPSPP